MQFGIDNRRLAGLIAAVVTTATFAKVFIPFYLIGSTPIFATVSALGIVLVAIVGRQTCSDLGRVTDILVPFGLFYAVVIVSFLSKSIGQVPATHLLGILIFHWLFMIFGFAAARSAKAVQLTLLAAAACYLIVIAQYTVRFGDLMQYGYLHDIFGIRDPLIFGTLHQNIGMLLGLAMLAGFGLSNNRIARIISIGAIPLLFLFLFYISARTALVALICSILFLLGARLYVRSKKLFLSGLIAVILVAAVSSGVFYKKALENTATDDKASDAISRTVRELQDPNPQFRMQIWARAWNRIVTEPDRLLFGRGVGMFPVDEGFGPPDWLLTRKVASKYYPHNIHLETLYETGIVGMLLFSVVALFPLAIAMARWERFSPAQRSIISMYVFVLTSSELSGGFAFSYDLLFFFGLSVGVIALKRAERPV